VLICISSGVICIWPLYPFFLLFCISQLRSPWCAIRNWISFATFEILGPKLRLICIFLGILLTRLLGRGAYAITWHPLCICRARFVTAGAIDPKLCTYVPLGKSNSQTKFRSSLILGLATRGQNRKHKKCYNYWTNGWIISKFVGQVSNKDTWHNTQVFDFTYFWRSHRSMLKMSPLVGTFRYCLT
jgi:hypothetical protein